MSYYCDPDSWWTCPYDVTHDKILAKRFQSHVIRCAKNNPSITRVRCMFNASHLCAPELLFEHMSRCPDNGCVLDALTIDMADFNWSNEQQNDIDSLESGATKSVNQAGTLSNNRSTSHVTLSNNESERFQNSAASSPPVIKTTAIMSKAQHNSAPIIAHHIEPKLSNDPFIDSNLTSFEPFTDLLDSKFEAIRQTMLRGGIGRGKPRHK